MKEKIIFILKTIDDKRLLTPKDKPVRMHHTWDLQAILPEEDIVTLLVKLQDEDQIIRISETPRLKKYNSYGFKDEEAYYYAVYVLPKFDEYYHRLASNSYNGPTEIPENKNTDSSDDTSNSKSDIVLEIKYLPSREVILNNIFLLAKPNLNSENDLVMSFLIKHPNEIIRLPEIEEGIRQDLNKPLQKIIDNLGFTQELKTAFFEVSKHAILFRNPISKNTLADLNIKYIRISPK